MCIVGYIVFILSTSLWLYADDVIIVHNKTEKVLYLQTYYLAERNAVTVGQRYTLLPELSIKVVRPLKIENKTRHLAFSFTEGALVSSLKKKQFERLPSIGIGVSSSGVSFDNFFIQVDQKGKLKGYTTVGWQALPKSSTNEAGQQQ